MVDQGLLDFPSAGVFLQRRRQDSDRPMIIR
jgi:hypothetical protein